MVNDCIYDLNTAILSIPILKFNPGNMSLICSIDNFPDET